MAKLIDVATLAQDLYYQDYASRDRFFDIEDFKYHCAAIYSKLLNSLYQVVRRENKAETGSSSVDINPQWLIEQDVDGAIHDETKDLYYVETSHDIFSFDFDAFGNGLNGVRPYGHKCNLKKISTQEVRFMDTIPPTSDIYYHLQGKKKIIFSKNPNTNLTLFYIPAIVGSDNNCVMSDNVVTEVIMATLQLMFGAKNGNVIHEADDGNKNLDKQTQSNPVLNKIQQL